MPGPPGRRSPGRPAMTGAPSSATWRRRQPKLKASVIHERLVAEHGFTGHYQRVKVYVRENRARLTEAEPEPAGCHRRAFAHFGGVPGVIVYDRTKTVVRRHVGRGQQAPLHPEAVAFAGHYDFAIWLAAPYRAQTKGRVERQVEIVRSHVLAGRSFASLGELDAAFATWLPIRRAQVHRTHGEVIGVRAERDRAALRPLPEQPYVVCDRHTRRVGKDALISFEASHYSVPWRRVRPGARVELRVTPAEVAIWSLGPGQELLATHPRALQRGGWIVDETHWDGLPDRVTAEPIPPCTSDCELTPAPEPEPGQLELPGIAGWTQLPAARVLVAHRTLATYDHAGGLTGGFDE